MKEQNALLASIATQAAEDLKSLIAEGNDDILTAIHKMQSEAQAQDAKPKFALGFKIAWDMDAGTYSCDLSWTLKQSLSTSHQLDDPNQTALPLDKFEDCPVIIKTGGGEVNTTVGKMKRVAAKLGKN
jgi:hypothetical protein